MPNPLSRLFRRWRAGDPVIVVSGLPRSGTSMMMKMLQAGGLDVLTDEVREADEDNPRGYYELERVKDLDKPGDKSWVRDARGKVVKVILQLLHRLPKENAYRVILMVRDLDEVLASQNKMLTRREEENPIEDERAKTLYERDLKVTRFMLGRRREFETLEVRYADALADARRTAQRVSDFLGGSLDAAAMAGVVEANLYRNRKDRLGAAAETSA